jgi:hypothetical protein
MAASFDRGEDFRCGSEISMHARKENEILRNSLEILDQVNITKSIKKRREENILGLLSTARNNLKKMSKKLTCLVSMDLAYFKTVQILPNVVVIKPKKAKYFKIPLKTMQTPLNVLIFNDDGHAYEVYASKS